MPHSHTTLDCRQETRQAGTAALLPERAARMRAGVQPFSQERHENACGLLPERGRECMWPLAREGTRMRAAVQPPCPRGLRHTQAHKSIFLPFLRKNGKNCDLCASRSGRAFPRPGQTRLRAGGAEAKRAHNPGFLPQFDGRGKNCDLCASKQCIAGARWRRIAGARWRCIVAAR